VLYQDVAIPIGTTTMTLSLDWGIKPFGAQNSNDSALFIGLYSTATVPRFQDSSLAGTNRLILSPSSSALSVAAPLVLPVTAFAGTTVRLAIINAMQSPSTGTLPPIVGGAIVSVSNISLLVPSPVPVVTSVSPNSGPTAGGTSVTITGSDFTGATVVRFGTTAATSFLVVNSTTISALSPAAPAWPTFV
jgi:hypothetical protein